VIELSDAEIDAFARITLAVTDRVIADLNAKDVLAAMRGN